MRQMLLLALTLAGCATYWRDQTAMHVPCGALDIEVENMHVAGPRRTWDATCVSSNRRFVCHSVSGAVGSVATLAVRCEPAQE